MRLLWLLLLVACSRPETRVIEMKGTAQRLTDFGAPFTGDPYKLRNVPPPIKVRCADGTEKIVAASVPVLRAKESVANIDAALNLFRREIAAARTSTSTDAKELLAAAANLEARRAELEHLVGAGGEASLTVSCDQIAAGK